MILKQKATNFARKSLQKAIKSPQFSTFVIKIMKAEEVIKLTFILMSGFSLARAGLSLDTAEIRVLDQSMGNCKVTVVPTSPKSLDLDVNALADAKDILVS